MVKVASVRFKAAGKVYYFDPEALELAVGDHVIVETARGMEYGTITAPVKEVEERELVSPLKKIIRIADEKDAKQHGNEKLRGEKIGKRGEGAAEKHGNEGRNSGRRPIAVNAAEAEKFVQKIFGESSVLQSDRQRLFGNQKKDG